jgi:hypothetical protein
LRGPTARYDDRQALFLMRLVRLMKLRTQLERQTPRDERRCRLVESAFQSTLADCEALGVEAEAHALLDTD